MKLAVAVYGAPHSSQASTSALRFVRTASTMGHEIVRVFFYHDAVHVANEHIVAPSDETDVAAGWTEFATQAGIELAVCVAASLKRGIVEGNVRAPFQIVGLGQLIDAATTADRFVTFA